MTCSWTSPKLARNDALGVIVGFLLFAIALAVWSSSTGDVRYPTHRQ